MDDCRSKIMYDAAPYPPIRIEEPNPKYAEAMLSNVGSNNSEISAVSLYFYNSVILKDDYPEIAQVFHKISMVEMHHLEIFAKLAMDLGADPRLWSCQRTCPVYWSPSYNQYPSRVIPLLKNAISAEKDAIEKYKRQAKFIQDKYIVKILNRIILDEQHHVNILSCYYQQVSKK